MEKFAEGADRTQAQLSYACSEDVFSWMRADWKNAGEEGASKFSMGSSYEAKKYTLSGELFFGPKNGEEAQEGIKGHPVWFNYGIDVNFDDKTDAVWSGTFSKDNFMHLAVNHKVDKNWSVGMHQHYYGSRLSEKRSPVDIGFNLSYKM